MKQVYVAIRVQQGHKREAVMEGVEALGYKHVNHPDALPNDEESLIVSWNLHGLPPRVGSKSRIPTIVVENPYIKFDKAGREYLAVGLGGHNGSGLTPHGSSDRLSRFGIRFAPWRADGDHILVIGQRGIGSTTMRSPPRWGEHMKDDLSRKTHRPVILRPHPGKNNLEGIPPLEDHLRNAYAVVMWASNCATEALIQGIPVFYNAPACVLQRACLKGVDSLEEPWKGDREPAFQDLAWAQWSLDEIRSGECFQKFLELG